MILWPKDNEIVKTTDKFRGFFRNREEESHKNCYLCYYVKTDITTNADHKALAAQDSNHQTSGAADAGAGTKDTEGD